MEQLIRYGYTPILDTEGYMPARVTAVHRGRFEMMTEQGVAFGQLKSGVYYADEAEEFPTVGDYVLIQYNELGDSQIVRTLERRSVFVRKDPSSNLHRSEGSASMQAVAANFDYVFIMSSLNKDFSIGRIERYLTLAWQSGAQPIIVLTKADLVEDYSEQLNAVRKIASRVEIHVISVYTGLGIEDLQFYLRPRKTLVFLGSSGVGKSSLLNALYGEERMKVSGIREDDSKGHHTTTHRQLVMLPSGAMVIDTPGIREVGMWEVNEGITEAFSDVLRYIGTCRFSDCTHTNEPGCAILQAIDNGELLASRYEDYCKIRDDAVSPEVTKAARARADKEFGVMIHKMKRQQKIRHK